MHVSNKINLSQSVKGFFHAGIVSKKNQTAQYHIIFCLLGSWLLEELIYPYSLTFWPSKSTEEAQSPSWDSQISQDERGIPISPLQG